MSITAKMKFKSENVHVLEAISGIEQLLTDVVIKTKLSGGNGIAQALLFAKDKATLDKQFPNLSEKLATDAVLWIAYPKKTGTIASDMTRDKGWNVVTADGYIPVTQVAIDEDWSALRFRKEEAVGPKLRDIAQAERQIEGVDFINRKVTLPKDASAALKAHKDLLELYNNMSFSHKKEYVEAIVTAKKPETRQRRIEKMITMLGDMQAKKKKK